MLIIYMLVLIFTSIYDFKYHKIPNIIHIIIFLIAIIMQRTSILGAITTALPFFIIALIFENSVGGGDVKYMLANGFMLGTSNGNTASLIALLTAAIFICLYRVMNNKNIKEIALAPFLSFGCMIVILGGIL